MMKALGFKGFYLWGTMDKLTEIGKFYKNTLQKSNYIIKIGRKGVTKSLKIAFTNDNFKHLIGVQHLDDIALKRSPSNYILQGVLNKKILYSDLTISKNFDDIQDRLENFYKIEEILIGRNIEIRSKYTYASKNKLFYNVEADYLLRTQDEEFGVLNLFIKQSGDIFFPVSFFLETKGDYTYNTVKWTILNRESSARIKNRDKNKNTI